MRVKDPPYQLTADNQNGSNLGTRSSGSASSERETYHCAHPNVFLNPLRSWSSAFAGCEPMESPQWAGVIGRYFSSLDWVENRRY